MGWSKLTFEQVSEIRLLYAFGLTADELALRYNVSVAAVRAIWAFKSWRRGWNPATDAPRGARRNQSRLRPLDDGPLEFRDARAIRRIADLPTSDGDPLASLLWAEEVERFRGYMAQLRPREREMLTLYVGDGLTFEQIGRKFNLHRERVRQILVKARKRLARILEIERRREARGVA